MVICEGMPKKKKKMKIMKKGTENINILKSKKLLSNVQILSSDIKYLAGKSEVA